MVRRTGQSGGSMLLRLLEKSWFQLYKIRSGKERDEGPRQLSNFA